MKDPNARFALRALAWAALGVVFGDIGTSPLYAMSETVSSHLLAMHGLRDKLTMQLGQYYGAPEVLGWTSLFMWALLIVVTIKYLVLILRADNHGEGGMFALLGLLKAGTSREFGPRAMGVIVVLAVVGSGLILGDGIITPSLSILSAWEGLEVVTDMWTPYIPWLSVGTLVALFAIQRLGTHRVGSVFAPVMVVWFSALAVMGAVNLYPHPEILAAFNPYHAVTYLIHNPRAALYVIGSVDLCITGCEALFADMGHFGRPAVRAAWFFFVWPALMLNYLGQGARLLDPTPIEAGNVFYALVPASPEFVYPLVGLSWAATVIASQALISGAFSLIHQGIQLGLFPRVAVIHTNAEVAGQIYLPAINWACLAACILLVAGFRNSHNLAPAYGLAVTGTMAFTTALFYLVATRLWGWKRLFIAPVCLLLIAIDAAFFVSNALQFFGGGYITIAIAAAASFVMLTWAKGRLLLGDAIRKASVPTEAFLESLALEQPHRVPGTAVFLTGNATGIPNSLLHYFKHAKTLHERVLLLTITTRQVPEVPDDERFAEVRPLDGGFTWVKAAYGFMESPDIPRLLDGLSGHGVAVSSSDVSYFLGRETLVYAPVSRMTVLRRMIFTALNRNAVPVSSFFKLPPGRVIEIGAQVEI